jgi:hypothetical protein
MGRTKPVAMKSLRCAVHFEEAAMHPVHRRLTANDALVRDELLHGHDAGDGPDTRLFYVEGDRQAYVDALESTERIVDYEVTPLSADACYAYVRERPSGFDKKLVDAFEAPGLLVVPPVEFRSDGTARLTVVGEPDALQGALESVPAAARVEVLRVREYGGPAEHGPEFTDRQREAVAAALKAGYYEVPREGSVKDVADSLGCAPGTAAEHLRKAERAAMAAAVERPA